MRARALTVPNALSGLRLLLVPIIAFLIGRGGHDALAVCLLMIAAVTDWLDGRIARRLNQVTPLGTLLDPLADRLAIVCVAVALGARGIVPMALVGTVALRDVLLLAMLPRLRKHGRWALPVTYLGKCATFALLTGLPLAYLAEAVDSAATAVASVIVLWLGAAAYWLAGVDYVRSVLRIQDLAG